MVHLFENNGYKIALDVNSGSVHVVDELAYALIPALEDAICEKTDRTVVYDKAVNLIGKKLIPFESDRVTDEDIRETASEIYDLYEAGKLYSKDVYEPYVGEFSKRDTVVKALCLHVAHDCNLRCRYCFAGEGEYHGDRGLMSLETGKKALDFVVANSGMRKNIEVDFFGGEPLLNWEVVKELVKYGRELEETNNKNFRFTLTTNGVLLNDEILEFINKEMANVVLSVDGRKEIHDKMRPMRGGQGSYDLIIPKFKEVAESRGQMNYYVRGTYTRYNTDFAADVLSLADLGFKQISVEPVVADPKEDYAIRDEDIDVLCKQYDILAREMLKRQDEGRGFNFFHFMIDLEGGPCVYKRLSGCGSGTEYVSITPNGDIYPCHQFAGEEDFKLGNVDEGIVNTELVEEFKGCNVYAKKECMDCFAKFCCSGGCAANSYHYAGKINGAYETGCKLQRKRVECALMLKAAQSEREESNTK